MVCFEDARGLSIQLFDSKRLAFESRAVLRQSCTPGESQSLTASPPRRETPSTRQAMAALEEAFGDVIQRQITDDASFAKWKTSAARREIVAFVTRLNTPASTSLI